MPGQVYNFWDKYHIDDVFTGTVTTTTINSYTVDIPGLHSAFLIRWIEVYSSTLEKDILESTRCKMDIDNENTPQTIEQLTIMLDEFSAKIKTALDEQSKLNDEIREHEAKLRKCERDVIEQETANNQSNEMTDADNRELHRKTRLRDAAKIEWLLLNAKYTACENRIASDEKERQIILEMMSISLTSQTNYRHPMQPSRATSPTTQPEETDSVEEVPQTEEVQADAQDDTAVAETEVAETEVAETEVAETEVAETEVAETE
eukprot:2136651-Rhodomonas_salina.1